MDISWFGQSCFKIKGKSASVVCDPFDPEMLGLRLPKDLTADILTISHQHGDHNNIDSVAGEPLVIIGPGEYEKAGVTVVGVGTFHDNNKGEERGKNTVFAIAVDGVSIVHLGDLGHSLSDETVSEIGDTDILLIPVGGNFTIDGESASKVVSQLEPRIVIPMHYKIEGLKLEIEGVDKFLSEMGVESLEPVNKLTITKDKLPEETQVVVLNKS